jgi:5-methylcytosine-specific restriction endonuclease McrA
MGREKKPRSIQSFIMPHLRRASRYWPPKSEARKKALRKVQIGEFKNGKPKFEDRYQCASCNELVPREESQMDHIVEVAALNGFDSWDATVARMFPNADGYQCLCLTCHSAKSQGNQKIRRESKKSKKTPLEKFEEYEKKQKK